eukprot:g18659.t1
MGSPISGLIAEEAMQRLESIALPQNQPQLWIRYVDDAFAIIKRIRLEEKHQLINNTLMGTKFTREEEKNEQLPFLTSWEGDYGSELYIRFVYFIPCKDCDKRYIGQTGRKLATRIHEHQRATKGHDQYSLVSIHTDKENHQFDCDNTRILRQAKHRQAQEFLEAWFSTKKAINKHVEL